MRNNKGFTLVELLVTITIMGILLVIAIPAVGNIVASNKDKKVEGYRIALERAAKLYIDENEREEFSHYDGCVTISYDTLKQANLIKEISDKDIECTYGNTYVVVTKKNKTYKYQASLDCKDKRNGGKEYKDGIDSCSNIIPDSEGPYITVTPDNQTDKWTTIKKAKKIKITLEDSGNVGFHFDKKVEYQWVKGDGAPSGSWQTLNMRNNEQATEVTTTLDKAKYPRIKGDEGLYYLHINPNSIVDIEGNKMDSSVRTKFGPYQFDEKAPECKVNPDRSANANDWYNKSVKLKLNPDDLGGSPIDKKGLVVASAKPAENYNNSVEKTVSTDTGDETKGVYGYSFVTDEAGNKCTNQSKKIRLDTKTPGCTVNANKKANGKGWNKSNVKLTLEPDTKGGSPIDKKGLVIATKQPSTNYNGTNSVTIDYETGGRIGYSFVTDKAGNSCKDKSRSVKIDKTKPDVYVYVGGPTTNGNYYNSAGFMIKDGHNSGHRYIRCYDGESSSGVKSGIEEGSFVGDITGNNVFHKADGFNSRTFIYSDTKSKYATHILQHTYIAQGVKNSTYECYDLAGNHVREKFDKNSGKHRKAVCVCRASHDIKNSSGTVVHSKNSVVISSGATCEENGKDVQCDCEKAHPKYGTKAGDLYLSCN